MLKFDYLFQEKECLLVFNFLSKLHCSTPCMRSEFSLAIIALAVMFIELHNEILLNRCVIHDFLLNRESDPNPSGMGFRVEEHTIDQFNFL